MKLKKILFTICFLIVLCGRSQTNEKNYLNLMNAVNENQLKSKLTILSSDTMEGRETGTVGETKAANYLASEFKKLGLIPGNKTSFMQPFTLFSYQTKSAEFILKGSGKKLDEEFYLQNDFPFQGKIDIEKVLCFLNDNLLDTAFLNGIKGKVLLIKNSNNYQTLIRFIDFIKRKGVLGCFVLDDKNPLSNSNIKSKFFTADQKSNFFLCHVAKALFKEILQKSQILNEKFPQEIDLKMTLTATFDKNTLNSKNVIGAIKGKTKPFEYVFVTCHYDHLGIIDGKIYNGADDDGSGTAAVLEIARVLSEFKTQNIIADRTIVFLANSGEEKGLLGSLYFTENSLYPLNKVNLDLNIDMIGRADPNYSGNKNNYVYLIGDDKLSSQLVGLIDTINTGFTKLELDRKYNDPNDPDRLYYRSDHYNFASKGVPVLFFFGGLHEDYHKPTDKIDKIDFKLLKLRTQLILLTAWKAATNNNSLVRDIPLVKYN